MSGTAWFKENERERNAWRTLKQRRPMDKRTVTSEGKTVAWIKANPDVAARDIEHLTALRASREADIRHMAEQNTENRELVHKLNKAMG